MDAHELAAPSLAPLELDDEAFALPTLPPERPGELESLQREIPELQSKAASATGAEYDRIIARWNGLALRRDEILAMRETPPAQLAASLRHGQVSALRRTLARQIHFDEDGVAEWVLRDGTRRPLVPNSFSPRAIRILRREAAQIRQEPARPPATTMTVGRRAPGQTTAQRPRTRHPRSNAVRGDPGDDDSGGGESEPPGGDDPDLLGELPELFTFEQLHRDHADASPAELLALALALPVDQQDQAWSDIARRAELEHDEALL